MAADPASGELRLLQEVMFRRPKYGIGEAVDEWPVSLFCFELLYADGEDCPACPTWSGGRGWSWIKLKRDYRSELTGTLDLAVVGALYGRGRRAGIYGALLLAVYDPDADGFPTICRCGTGFSDAKLAGLPACFGQTRCWLPRSTRFRWWRSPCPRRSMTSAWTSSSPRTRPSGAPSRTGH